MGPHGRGLAWGHVPRMSVDEQLDEGAPAHLAPTRRRLRVDLVTPAERADHPRLQAERLDQLHGLVDLHAADVRNGDDLRALADLERDRRALAGGAGAGGLVEDDALGHGLVELLRNRDLEAEVP